MPKRSNPSTANDDDTKKARLVASTDKDTGSSSTTPTATPRLAKSVAATAVGNTAASTSRNAAPLSSAAAAPTDKKKPIPATFSSSAVKTRAKAPDRMPSSNVVSNGGSGGNAFLRAQRAAKVAAAPKPAAKSQGNEVSEIQEEKKCEEEEATPSEDLDHSNIKCPSDVSGGNGKSSSWMMLLILLLLASNIAAAFYFVSKESMQNISLLRCSTDLSTTQEEVSSSRDATGVLRAAMEETQRRNDFLDKALQVQKDVMEVATRDGNSSRGNGTGGLSEEDRNEWKNKMRAFESEKEKLRAELNHRLEEFDK